MPISKIIITSGPTREWIDPVRYISNASSGKMGFNLATQAKKICNNVVYISGGTEDRYKVVDQVKNVSVVTTVDLLDAVSSEIMDDTLLIMAAAPADYRPRNPSDRKLKKNPSNGEMVLELIENPDILKTITKQKMELGLEKFYMLGFSAETESLETNAVHKLQSKGLDWIAGNLVGKEIGFGEVESTIHLFSKDGSKKIIGPGDKEFLALEIIKFLQSEISKNL
ncbi:phosphopantothenoylcysteine decarboxylase domain-containing protein [Leptospira sp. GIMC2001]|uniref:phosphopantothenoylcysteine decarboxylase domain-containing protein n=1 Tax=Leptospira sp. GIMC2001 TaxID=1513297 RepID=UPI00234AC944|nr:phosphopantothenoylcysteine decarboxylase [Leptospira sp. GIMC2001]WCL51394.1 phosphopantothenoylcysteine decarboxylase [Leptospira sp. GIMC2001]